MKKINISTKICKTKLKNPTILASGILGVTASSLIRVAKFGAGAVTTKSIGPEKREGHKNPVVAVLDNGMLNAVGLSCPDINEAIDELGIAVKKSAVPVIASIYGRTIAEFGDVAEKISKADPDFIEANISCPNVEDEFGMPFGCNPEIAAKVVETIKNSSKIPLIVKLTPNVPDIRIIAEAVENSGADAISAINTIPGMLINIETGKPVLSNKTGGLSGPAIKPIAIRCVYDIYETVDIPIIGIGGIQTGRDAIEMMMAGASAVGIGTGVMNRGMGIFRDVCNEIGGFMKKNNYSRLEELIGEAHD
jgi:dihydroorotate dehydrogenase (NAD+) catalytic subunit